MWQGHFWLKRISMIDIMKDKIQRLSCRKIINIITWIGNSKIKKQISTHLLTVLTTSGILSTTNTLLFIYVAVKYVLYLYN